MYLWWQVWKPQHHHQAHSICVNWAYASIIWVTFDELLMLFMDLNINPCYVTPCSPIYTYVSRHIRVCYCKLNTSTKELVLSYFIVMRCLWNDNDVIYVYSIFLMCLSICISQLLVTKWLMYKEIVQPSAPPYISLFKSCFVLWLPAWWALWLPWWPPARCNNILMYLLIFTINFCYCFIVVICWK